MYDELFTQFTKALKNVKKHPWLLVVSSLIDLALLFVFSIISYFGYGSLMPRLNDLSNLISKNPTLLSAGIGSGNLGIPVEAFNQFKILFNEMIWIFVIYLIVLLIVLSIILGFNWNLSFKIHKKFKGNLVFRFIKVFATYFIVFAGISIISLIISIDTLFQSEGIINFVLISLGVILLYLFLINISLIKKYSYVKSIKKTFNIINKNFITTVLAFVIVIIMFFAVHLISRLLGFLQNIPNGYFVWLIITGIMFLPIITIARLFMIKVIEKLEK